MAADLPAVTSPKPAMSCSRTEAFPPACAALFQPRRNAAASTGSPSLNVVPDRSEIFQVRQGGAGGTEGASLLYTDPSAPASGRPAKGCLKIVRSLPATPPH